MQARRMARRGAEDEEGDKESAMNAIDGFEGGLRELLGLFKKAQDYVKKVVDGKEAPDLAVGRGLTATLCAEPAIDLEAVEGLCKSSLQDGLMVVYLSDLTRTQISIAEKI